MGRRIGPIAVLLVLAPICVDLLFGATRLSTLPELGPRIATVGVAAVLIRDWVRASQRTNWMVLVLALAFGLASEVLILQTSVAPLVGGQTDPDFGRALGVNWPYLVWAIGFQAVWGIVVPIQLTEMIFPDRAERPWLTPIARRVGLLIFLGGALWAWHTWTRVIRPEYLHAPAYRPPWTTLLVGLVVVLVVVGLAFGVRVTTFVPLDEADLNGSLPPPGLVGVGAALLGLAWFAPVDRAWPPGVSPAVPVLVSLAVGVLALVVVRNATVSREWRESDRVALVAGALVAAMAAGFVVNTFATAGELAFRIIVDGLAVSALAVLIGRNRHNAGPER